MGGKRDERVIGVTMVQIHTCKNKSYEAHCCVLLIWANKACVKTNRMNFVTAYSHKHYVLAQLWGHKEKMRIQATAEGTNREKLEKS